MRENDWLIKIAYGANRRMPEQVSLCQMFWKTVFMMFIGWPVIFGFIALVTVVASIISFLFAARPIWFNNDDEAEVVDGFEDTFVYYTNWPRVKGRRVFPIFAIIPLGLLTLLAIYHKAIWVFTVNHHVIINILALLLIAVVTVYLNRKSNLVKMFVDYAKTFKTKACPIIRIEKVN